MLAARQELGPESESAVIAAFLERASSSIEARVEERLAEISPPVRERIVDNGGFWLAAITIGMGIPITGVATSLPGPGNILVAAIAWTAVVLVNVAFNLRRGN
ncbi:hypothetical protein [Amycolatopsis sp. GA6-003]|uniref:hypothetical protein n=1 Tax=Amycolatopsis sp. GA6-003 TaxID=2652444 RepID=UPI003916E791